MNDFLKHVSPGDPIDGISAKTFNCMIDSAKAYRDRASQFREVSQGNTGNITQFLFENTSGVDCDTFEILAMDGFSLTADDSEERMLQSIDHGCFVKGIKPTPQKPFGILLQPLASEEIGKAVISGPAPCKVDIKKSCHRFAEPIEGETKHLQSTLAGPVEILASEPGTGIKWCYVNLNSGWTDASYWGVLKTALTAGTNQSATATLTIPGTTENEDVTAYTFPGFPVKATAIGKAVYVKFHPLDRKWYFVLIDC